MRDLTKAKEIMSDYFGSASVMKSDITGVEPLMDGMRMAQVDMINVYYPTMDKPTKRRANRTLKELSGLLPESWHISLAFNNGQFHG
jgi:hypothetical protein